MGIENTRVLLASENHGARSIIKTILVNMGFNNIEMAQNYTDLEDKFLTMSPDLLIFDSGFSSNEIYDLVKKIRHNNFGINPFLTVIALSNKPTEKVVSGVMQSGVDDLFIQPYSTGQFIDRIQALVDDRKQFVVTSDYIGPDRRAKSRVNEGEVIPLVTVPNALSACVNNTMNREKFNASVKAVADEVNIMRLDRNGVQATWLVSRILAGFSWADGHELDPEIIGYLERLSEVSTETSKRLLGTPFSHVSSICNSLKQLSEKILTDSENVTAKDQELLRELAEALRISFKEVDSDKIAEAIFEETKRAL